MVALNVQVGANTDDVLWLAPAGGSGFTDTFTLQVGSSASSEIITAIRFTGVAIPPGSGIDTAVLTLRGGASSVAGLVTAMVRAVAQDNAAAPTTAANGQALPRTTTGVAWTTPDPVVDGTDYTLPDISDVIQEVVDRPGWASGNALVIYVISDPATPDWRIKYFRARNTDAAGAPRLALTYTEGAGGGGETSPWTEWNGTTEVELTLEGEWNGTTVQPLTFDQITA